MTAPLPDPPIPTAYDPGLTLCPHCASKTRLIVDDRFRWVCGACGGARVPTPDPRAHSAAEKEHLLRSTSLVRKAHLIGVGAGLTGVGATVAALFAMFLLFVLHVSGFIPLVAIAASGILSMLTLTFGRAARGTLDEAKEAVTGAWEEVLQGLMRIENRPMTAGELGRMMTTTEPDAERLLTLLQVDDRVTSVVNDDGQIRYELPARMRVEDPIATAATTLAPRVESPLATAPTTLAPRVESPFATAATTLAPRVESPLSTAKTELAARVEDPAHREEALAAEAAEEKIAATRTEQK